MTGQRNLHVTFAGGRATLVRVDGRTQRLLRKRSSDRLRRMAETRGDTSRTGIGCYFDDLFHFLSSVSFASASTSDNDIAGSYNLIP